VKQWRNASNTTCLLGNHDMSYGVESPESPSYLSGCDAAKWITINGILTARDWQKFRLHVWMEGGGRTWLVTHAGLHSCWLECVEANEYHSFIDAPAPMLGTVSNRGEHHFFLGRGVSRSDDQSIGGINWLDWDEMVQYRV